MIKKGVNFLTTKTIDTKKLLEVLGNTKNLDVSDLEILEKILSDFNNKYFSLLSAQEIQFLNLNSTDMWASYLIFRYKFKPCRKN